MTTAPPPTPAIKQRPTLNPFSDDDHLPFEAPPIWYKERYLVNYASQDDNMFVLT